MAGQLSRRDMLKLAGLLAAIPAGQALRMAHAQSEWRLTGTPIDVLAGFDQTIQAFMEERNISKGTFALTWQSQLMMVRGYNRGNWDELVVPNTLFRVASLSKPITATAVLQLVERRLLTLETRVASLLNLDVSDSDDPRWQDITVLHLLQHSGGFDRTRSGDPMFSDERIARDLNTTLPITAADVFNYMLTRPLDFEPGTAYVYSNFGYVLLGRVIEAVSGLSYADYVQQNIFAPLGMTQMQLGRSLESQRLPNEVSYTALTSNNRRRVNVINPGDPFDWAYGGFNLENMAAAAGWVGSVVEMARFATAFDNIFTSPLLSADFIRVMFRAPSYGLNEYGSYYACGWDVRPMNAWFNTWHIGNLAGVFTLMLRRFDGMNWVVFFNQRSDPDNDRESYYEIDSQLYATAESINEVPVHDLFEVYL